MTQLFDTATYDASQDRPATASTPLPRLLHAVSTTPDPALSAQWRLDDSTIEIGRRGIAKARAALRDISRSATPISAAGPSDSRTAVGDSHTIDTTVDTTATADGDHVERKAA